MAKKKAPARTTAKDLLPKEVLSFLEERGGESMEFDPDKTPDMEVDSLVFHTPRSLRKSKFTINTHEYYANRKEKGVDPELEYDVPGIDLVAECEAYDPEGILVWFPTLAEFGFWDPDHGVIGLFPGTTWETIAKKLPRYVNAQWNDTPRHKLLRPWADERCADLKGKRA